MDSLLLTQCHASTPFEVAEWFGAMQAQDVASGLWSLGVRRSGSTVTDVEAAFESRDLVRSWPMRQTVHIVPAKDLTWMLNLTGRRGLERMIERRQALGLLPADLRRLESVVAAALAADEPLARATLLAALAEEGIPTDGQRGYHMLLYCSLIGLTCIGPQREDAQTIALLSSWAPPQRELTRDEALAELAHRYFRGHGPATLQDFAGWTGLTLTDARRALDLNDGRLVPSSFGEGGDRTWWATRETALQVAEGVATTHKALALPGFDEYMLGYKDRSLHGDTSLLDRIVPGGNGVFRATVVRAGVAIATWTRTLRGDRVEVEVQPFGSLSATARRETQRALETYAVYLQRRLVVRFAD